VTGVVEDIRSTSPQTDVVVEHVEWRDPWDFEQVFDGLWTVASRLQLDPEQHDVLVHITTGTHVAQICLFLLTESGHFPGRLVQTSPPARQGDPARWTVIDLDLARYDRLAARFADDRRRAALDLKAGIQTRNRAFNQLMDELEHVVTRSTDPILLTGPTGAGKTQLARRIWELRRQRHMVKGELVELNCATLRGDQAAAALFGHSRGAFTGAVNARTGLLLSADGGMLFLDEIGELGLDEQAMLLKAIEEGVFYPVGSDKPVHTSFTLVAGTNRDLHKEVGAGRFREDLLARIEIWSFRLPSLRERIEDLEPNLDHELARWTQRTGRRVTINADARQTFLEFARSSNALWSSNFRDLNAAVVRMATMAQGGRITVNEVLSEQRRLQASWYGSTAIPAQVDRVHALLGDRAHTLDRFDRVQLQDVLEVCAAASTMSEAGRTLFAGSLQQRRSRNDADRLRKYLARFELTFAMCQGGGVDATSGR
jgi:transcriptional regulatory protein RtcR